MGLFNKKKEKVSFGQVEHKTLHKNPSDKDLPLR